MNQFLIKKNNNNCCSLSLYLLVRYEHVQDAINILWAVYSCLGISTAFSLPDLIIILLFQVTSFMEFFFIKYKSTVSHSPIEWAYYMLLALESQICVVIVLQKEFNRTMTCRRSTEFSCLCVKPVWGTKSQYLNEILSKTDKTWTWCCIIVSSHICWINFETDEVFFSRKQQHNVLQTLFRKKEKKKKKNLPTYLPIPKSVGRVWANWNIFNGGLIHYKNVDS